MANGRSRTSRVDAGENRCTRTHPTNTRQPHRPLAPRLQVKARTPSCHNPKQPQCLVGYAALRQRKSAMPQDHRDLGSNPRGGTPSPAGKRVRSTSRQTRNPADTSPRHRPGNRCQLLGRRKGSHLLALTDGNPLQYRLLREAEARCRSLRGSLHGGAQGWRRARRWNAIDQTARRMET